MSAEPLALLERCAVRRTEGGLEVMASVANAADHPVFATCDLRRLQVDDAGQVMTLWFSDAGRDLGRREPGLRHHAVPHVVAIDPGKRHALRIELPSRMNRLIVHDDESFDVETIDLSRIQRVDLRVTVAEEPFYPNPKRSLLAQLDRWGRVIDAQVRVSDSRAGGAEPQTT